MIQFDEKLDPEKILKLLSRSIPYYLNSWHDLDDETGLFGSLDPQNFNMRKIGSSSPVIEYVIRPHLQILCVFAALINRDYFTEEIPITKEETINRLIKGLRWVCDTHLTGSLDVEQFLDRKRWGENWRSSLWASMIGIIHHLTNSHLDKKLTSKIEEILAFEADRFIGVLPPDGCEIDTKLEENAQDTMLMAWAINTLPNHPHANQWKRALGLWAVNIATTIHDKADHTRYLDKSVAAGVTTQTLFPDMTAENHGFFHPEVLSYGSWIVLAMAAYALNNRETPGFFRRKTHQQTFDVLLRFCLPNGMIYAPGGNDFPMFLPRPFALGWGLWNNDPRAIRITTKLLNWIDTMSSPQDGGTAPWIKGFRTHYEGWELLFQSQVGFEFAMLSVLPFPKEVRFYSSGQIESAVDTRQTYSYVQVCYRRNTRTTRSMAWKALGKHPVVCLNIHSYPELVSPAKAAMLGVPKVGSSIKYWEVAFHNDGHQRYGFDTYGRIYYFGSGKERILCRDIRVLAWGDEGLVIFDSIKAEKDLFFDEQYLSPIYIVNDHWTNNRINLISGSLRECVSANSANSRILSCPSFWASVEAHLLFQFIWGRTKGLVYVPGNERNAPRYWNNCRFDMLAMHVEGAEFKKGDTVYEIGFFTGTGKGPRPFKSAGSRGDFFKGIVIMDGKYTIGLT